MMGTAEEIVRAVVERLVRSEWWTARCPDCRRRLMDYHSNIEEGSAEIDRICPGCKRTVRLSIGGEQQPGVQS